jgi:hypothetical protein
VVEPYTNLVIGLLRWQKLENTEMIGSLKGIVDKCLFTQRATTILMEILPPQVVDATMEETREGETQGPCIAGKVLKRTLERAEKHL